MREKMQKEHDDQIKLQKEIEKKIEEENKKREELKIAAEKQFYKSYLKSSDLGIEQFINQPSFNQNDSSIVSNYRSESEEYSSFINDIRTVYELQDEDCKEILYIFFSWNSE